MDQFSNSTTLRFVVSACPSARAPTVTPSSSTATVSRIASLPSFKSDDGRRLLLWDRRSRGRVANGGPDALGHEGMSHTLLVLLLSLCSVAGLVLIALGLPGIWLIVVAVVAGAVSTGFHTIRLGAGADPVPPARVGGPVRLWARL